MTLTQTLDTDAARAEARLGRMLARFGEAPSASYRVGVVARLLGWGETKVRGLIDSDTIHSLKRIDGCHRYVPHDELVRLLALYGNP